jgi:GTPase
MENKKNLSGLINSLLEECKNQGEIKESIQIAINETEEESKSNFINLVFIGNFNAGKTTMINSVVASITNNYDNNVRLISSKSENSYFPIVVERSPDEYYYMTILISNKTPEEIKCQNP